MHNRISGVPFPVMQQSVSYREVHTNNRSGQACTFILYALENLCFMGQLNSPKSTGPRMCNVALAAILLLTGVGLGNLRGLSHPPNERTFPVWWLFVFVQ